MKTKGESNLSATKACDSFTAFGSLFGFILVDRCEIGYTSFAVLYDDQALKIGKFPHQPGTVFDVKPRDNLTFAINPFRAPKTAPEF